MNSNKPQALYSWIINPFAIALLVVFAAQAVYFPFLREHVFAFIFFAFVYLFIPSLALSQSLFKDANWGGGIRLLLAYPLVLCAYFVIAWILTILQVPLFVHVIPVASIAFLLLSRRNIPIFSNVIAETETWLAIAIYSLIIILMWIGFWVPYAPPAEGQVGVIYQDLLWNVGNTWSSIRGGWPLPDARALGEPLSYHLSQSFVHSVAYRITDIHPLYLQNYFFPVLDELFLAAVLVWVVRVVGSVPRYSVMWLCVVLLLAQGWRGIDSVYAIESFYHDHVFWNPLTFFYSLAPLLIFLFVLKAYFEERIRLPIYYLAGLYLFVIASKSVLALILLPALALIFILKVVRKNHIGYKDELLLGGLCVAGTVAVKYMIFSSGERGLHIGTAIEGSRIWEWLTLHLIGIPNMIVELIFGLYLYVSRLPLFLVSPAGGVLIVLAFLLYKGREQTQIQRGFVTWSYFVIAMVLVSQFDRYFLQYAPHVGSPVIYFEWYPIWFLPILAAGWIPIVHINRQAWVAIIAITIAGVVYFGQSAFPGVPTLSLDRRDTRETIDFGEWEASMWIERNLPKTATIASDRRGFCGLGKKRMQGRFFYYSALTGRQILLEGEDFFSGEARSALQDRWSLLENILEQKDTQALGQYLRASQAQYFFQSTRFDKLDLNELTDFTLVYQNSSARIFNIPHNK